MGMMWKTALSLLLCAGMIPGAAYAQKIRDPVWAGQFYPADPDRLSSRIESWLDGPAGTGPEVKPAALISPHAGFMYSGRVAAQAYRLIKGRDYHTVVLIGPSHHHGFRGFSIYKEGGYRSPLGVAEVDSGLAEKISRWTGYGYVSQAHAKEHSIEVQIPFVQKSLPRALICPIVMGAASRQDISRLSEALVRAADDKEILVVASTDLSHFLNRKEARKKDKKTISLIKNLKISALIRKLENRENIMCGGTGVAAVLKYAESLGKPRVEILEYDDSTAGGGPESRVVGYLAAAVFMDAPENEFSRKDQQELFEIARKTITRFAQEGIFLVPSCTNPRLLANRGAFVTLKKKGRLRGCIGFVESRKPLFITVAEAAVLASCRDARFPPVKEEELKEINLEISVLTPPAAVQNPARIQVGRHGLIITKNGKKGLLLPQVAVKNNWTRETFLAQTCLKAGLRQDAWKNGAEIYIFEADVFGEDK
jgi:hypothetical protein